MKKFKIWLMTLCLATLAMGAITAYVYAYNSSQEERFDVFFCLRQTEPAENYTEIFDPLDPWTSIAINKSQDKEVTNTLVPWENLTQWILYPYWKMGLEQWKNTTSCREELNIVFKYHNCYYKFGTPDIFWTPAPPPSISLRPLYGGWTGISIGWIATAVIYRRHKK